ncbi:aminotransferase class V-fold PLP-dependent enzyme [Eubacterium oxidoreducens]|uniref:cysteine desulfurase n=1 Tax=Eubacterium oxidoreducens TaxID=1732 RepID=A0A1G6C1Z1_EUBOX|nr:SufS family cysteine desulfurase [Eubacterium oxidoreducens]SDB26828.1 cysteine desulfurase / selenocysteine lyase [Eubacterium oxidoreducens]
MYHQWRADFPILDRKVHNHTLVYLDNAATSQMPRQVIESIAKHHMQDHANIHRGIHQLSEISTKKVEDARELIAQFVGCREGSIIFTAGTTDAINIVAAGYREMLTKQDAIMVTQLEHHSNYVPWQQACFRSGAEFLVCPAKDGELDLDYMEEMLKTRQVRLVAVAHVTNLTGTVNPIKEIVALAHRYKAKVLIDGAQGILHQGIDVHDLDCEYYCFSGHKMLGPTGIGVLYGKTECLNNLKKVRFGGGMVDLVTEKETTWGPIPHCFEAGTPNITGAIGLAEAVRYINEHDFLAIRNWEEELLAYTVERLEKIEGVRIFGHPKIRAGAVSFEIEGVHPYDLASMIDKMGIAVRSGNLCAQPALASLGADKAVRISPAFYNTKQDIDSALEAMQRVIKVLLQYKV